MTRGFSRHRAFRRRRRRTSGRPLAHGRALRARGQPRSWTPAPALATMKINGVLEGRRGSPPPAARGPHRGLQNRETAAGQLPPALRRATRLSSPPTSSARISTTTGCRRCRCDLQNDHWGREHYLSSPFRAPSTQPNPTWPSETDPADILAAVDAHLPLDDRASRPARFVPTIMIGHVRQSPVVLLRTLPRRGRASRRRMGEVDSRAAADGAGIEHRPPPHVAAPRPEMRVGV